MITNFLTTVYILYGDDESCTVMSPTPSFRFHHRSHFFRSSEPYQHITCDLFLEILSSHDSKVLNEWVIDGALARNTASTSFHC